jgi:hypothetical protein
MDLATHVIIAAAAAFIVGLLAQIWESGDVY